MDKIQRNFETISEASENETDSANSTNPFFNDQQSRNVRQYENCLSREEQLQLLENRKRRDSAVRSIPFDELSLNGSCDFFLELDSPNTRELLCREDVGKAVEMVGGELRKYVDFRMLEGRNLMQAEIKKQLDNYRGHLESNLDKRLANLQRQQNDRIAQNEEYISDLITNAVRETIPKAISDAVKLAVERSLQSNAGPTIEQNPRVLPNVTSSVSEIPSSTTINRVSALDYSWPQPIDLTSGQSLCLFMGYGRKWCENIFY
ncbi:hypothetical protein U1Q18_042392 [Sarracenia purpurea var. burkii]